MIVGVTGGTGFVGGKVAERLVEKSIQTRILSRRPESLQHSPSDTSIAPELCPVEKDELSYKRLDLSSSEELESSLRGISTLIHCAGRVGTWGSYLEYYQDNVLLTKNLLLAAKKAGVKRFIFLSSGSIYFQYRHQFNLQESQVAIPFVNPYAQTKYIAEKLVLKANEEDFQTVSLRPRGVIGAGDSNWLPRIIELREQQSLVQVGKGENRVNFTSINNLVDAIELCLTAPREAMGEAYNINNGINEPLWDVIEQALDAVGLNAQRKKLPFPIMMALSRLNEATCKFFGVKKEPLILPLKVGISNFSLTMDITKAKKKLGYTPQQSSWDAINDFAHWWPAYCLKMNIKKPPSRLELSSIN